MGGQEVSGRSGPVQHGRVGLRWLCAALVRLNLATAPQLRPTPPQPAPVCCQLTVGTSFSSLGQAPI